MGEHIPYKSNSELPETVKNSLPGHGQDIYTKAFNKGWEAYKKPSERRGNEFKKKTAHKVAWSAVKKIYEKDSKGNWVEKDEYNFRITTRYSNDFFNFLFQLLLELFFM